MLVVCVAVGWKYERVRKQREAVAWVHEMGGTVTYEPRGPEWLRKGLGRDFFDDVTGVSLDATEVSDLSPLAKLTNLETLTLGGTPLSDVSPLAKLTKLELLYLNNTQVSEQAIEQLKTALPQCTIFVTGGRTNQ